MSERCLYCYKPLAKGETDFHARCCRRIFGMRQAPVLPYRRSEVAELAREVVRSQTAVTGVQPKLSLDIDRMSDAPKRFTIVGLWGRYILKPQTEMYAHLPELEDVTMHLAEMARIETVPHTLLRFDDGELCYITRRIDRTESGGKIAMEDMCQLSERLTEDKYRSSHEQIAKQIARYSTVPLLDLAKYWEQVVFAWVVGNADMHLKNYSLYSPDGETQMLTPAYDLLSTAIVLPSDTEELALTVVGRKRKLKPQNFAEAMAKSGISERVAASILSKFPKYRQRWADFIRISFLPEDMQQALISLIDCRLAVLEGK